MGSSSSVSQLPQNLSNKFLSSFNCGFPWAILPDGFWIFEKKNAFAKFSGFFFSVFVNMRPYGRQNFKTLLLPQITFDSFQTFLNFLLSGPHKSSTVLDFWNFELLIFHDLFSFSSTWDPMGAKTSKRYSSLKSILNFSNFSWILSSVVLTKVLFWIFLTNMYLENGWS